MKCHEVEQLLVAYLNSEVGRSERELIRAHVAGCEGCQRALARASELQTRMSRALHTAADQTSLSPRAWARLQAQLMPHPEPTLSYRLKQALTVANFTSAIVPRAMLLLATVAVISVGMLTYSLSQSRPVVVSVDMDVPQSGVLLAPVTNPAGTGRFEQRRVSGPAEDSTVLRRAQDVAFSRRHVMPRMHASEPDVEAVNADPAPSSGKWLLPPALPPAAAETATNPASVCPTCTQLQ